MNKIEPTLKLLMNGSLEERAYASGVIESRGWSIQDKTEMDGWVKSITLFKSPENVSLKGIARLTKYPDQGYLRLEYAVVDDNGILRKGDITKNNRGFNIFTGMVFGHMEAYLSGLTNIKAIKEVYNKYKLK